jgi:hypothetical protein
MIVGVEPHPLGLPADGIEGATDAAFASVGPETGS